MKLGVQAKLIAVASLTALTALASPIPEITPLGHVSRTGNLQEAQFAGVLVSELDRSWGRFEIHFQDGKRKSVDPEDKRFEHLDRGRAHCTVYGSASHETYEETRITAAEIAAGAFVLAGKMLLTSGSGYSGATSEGLEQILQFRNHERDREGRSRIEEVQCVTFTPGPMTVGDFRKAFGHFGEIRYR